MLLFQNHDEIIIIDSLQYKQLQPSVDYGQNTLRSLKLKGTKTHFENRLKRDKQIKTSFDV